MLGTDLKGKRLGVPGMGRIGQAVAHRARAFGMIIHYHNRRPATGADALAATYHDSVDGLLAVSDVLSINCPGTPDTYHLINDRTIALMLEGAILVNTARGSIVDDKALLKALRSRRLRAAGLDVFEGEPDVNPGYFTTENCYILPHMGSVTVETRNAMGYCCLDNIAAYFEGLEPPSRVA
jgi:lactate dehydrogenase-like 2-hydroxyacid dehydrogenase